MGVLDIFKFHSEFNVSTVNGSANYMLWLLSSTAGDMFALFTVNSILSGFVDYASCVVAHKLDQLSRDILLIEFHTYLKIKLIIK